MTKLSDEALLKELEKRFKDNSKTLQELREMTEELKKANKKLEESEALKSHFISNITNEIQNPFSSILGLSKNILTVEKQDWKTIIKMVSHIYSEAFSLDFQFQNIFMAAKIEAGELALDVCNVNISTLIENLIDQFKFESKKKKIHVRHTCNMPKNKCEHFFFRTDPEKLKLILSNHLSNAIKFSYENSEIEIVSSLPNKQLEISVKDQGEGISPENQQVIFDRFKRVDSEINSLNRGHGLGLSINKALLDLIAGQITIDTKENKGSTFTILIPESAGDVKGIATDDNEFFFFDDENEDEASGDVF